jgi:hypothetical protein
MRDNSSFAAIKAIFVNFFPFLGNLNLAEIKRGLDFDFSGFQNVSAMSLRLSGVDFFEPILIIEKSNGPYFKSDFFSATDKEGMLNVFAVYGQELQNIDFDYASGKNLSKPKSEWLEEKMVLGFRDTAGPSMVGFIITWNLLQKLFNLTGYGYAGELSKEVFQERFFWAVSRLEKQILWGENLLFMDHLYLLRELDGKIFNDLVRKLIFLGFLDFSQLASLYLLDAALKVKILSLPEKFFLPVRAQAEKIMPAFLDEREKMRWQRQLGYYLHNLLSAFLFQGKDNPVAHTLRFMVPLELRIAMERLRFEKKLPIYSLDGMLAKIIEFRNTGPLLSRPGKELIIEVSALGEKLNLQPLFAMFNRKFEMEINFRIEKRKWALLGKKANEKEALYLAAMRSLLNLLTIELVKSIKISEEGFSLDYLYRKLAGLKEDQVMLLYNKLGFELFSEIFEIFQYSQPSPLKKEGEARGFMESLSAHLPLVEATIVEDIFLEKINRERIYSERGLTRKFQVIQKEIQILEFLNLI